jgi:serine/threonine-protein kinase 24/25/MST4
VKATNVLLSLAGRVALADFTLSAKLKKGRKNETLTGSPCWMAPEILEGGEGYDNAVDIW